MWSETLEWSERWLKLQYSESGRLLFVRGSSVDTFEEREGGGATIQLRSGETLKVVQSVDQVFKQIGLSKEIHPKESE